jgi:hypothetical protein
MRLRVVALVGLFGVGSSWLRVEGAEVAIPQNPQARMKRQREVLSWNEKTLVGAYERVGEKSPRWDRQAREALGLMARLVSKAGDPLPSPSEVRAAFKKAVDAGCHDPLIVFNHVRYNVLGPDRSSDRPLAEAVDRLLGSNYPSVRKATALYISAARKSVRAKTDPKAARESVAEVDKALGLLSRSFAEDGAGTALEHVWLENLRNNVTPTLQATQGSLKAVCDHVDAALAKVPAAKTIRLIYRGIMYKEYAWEARGTGYADTVSPENAQKFHDRLEVAAKAMREAWALNPEHNAIPIVMLEVAKGLGSDRQEMEEWFQRAMSLDSNNLWACGQKLDWLSSRWYGSDEEVVAFGRMCRDSENYPSGIPLLLVTAHYDVCSRLPEDQMREYLSREDVWRDVGGVFEEHLKRFPNDKATRTRYAAFGWLSKRYGESARQFRTLGDGLVADKNFSKAFLKRARNDSNRMAGAVSPSLGKPWPS